jgi:hypothetical protein
MKHKTKKIIDIIFKENIIIDKSITLEALNNRFPLTTRDTLKLRTYDVINKNKKYKYVFTQRWKLNRIIYEYVHKIKLKKNDFIKHKDDNSLNLLPDNLVCINEIEEKIKRKAHKFWENYRFGNRNSAIKYIESTRRKNRTIGATNNDLAIDFWEDYRYLNYRNAYKLQWYHSNKNILLDK